MVLTFTHKYAIISLKNNSEHVMEIRRNYYLNKLIQHKKTGL